MQYKETIININGSTKRVKEPADCTDVVIYDGFKELARGNDLKSACYDFEYYRSNKGTAVGEMLEPQFEASDFYKGETAYLDEDGDLDYEKYHEDFDRWEESLDGIELFDYLRDGTYNDYVDWATVVITNDDNDDEE